MKTQFTHRHLVSLFALTFLLWTVPCYAAPDLAELTVAEAQKLMDEGKLSSQQLVKYYLENISQNNTRGQNLRAVGQINPQALTEAKQMDRERREGKVRGMLHGIPVLLKDNIDTADGMANTAGSLALKDHYPKDDAQMVSQLRKQGAVILGKTNLSEWANFRSFYSSSGWSGMYGQTRNPHDPSRNACGSSSGSGAAVAAHFASLAIGTETDGSVVCPSAVNGLVGIKPSLGTVSRDGIIPIAHSQDTAGPMANSVTDAVYLLQAMASVAADDPLSQTLPDNLHKHLIKDGLAGKRIGIARNLMGFHYGVDEVFEHAITILQKAGAQLIDIELPNKGKFGDAEFEVLLYEFKHGLNHYLREAQSDHTLATLIEFNRQNKARSMPLFGQELFLMAQEKGPLTEESYLSALKKAKRLSGKEGIDAVIQEHELDLIVSPTSQPAWKIDQVNGDHFMGGSSSFAAVSGYPHITVPMGTFKGLPVGMSFFAGNLSEATLIEAAYAFEQASKSTSISK